MLGGEKAADEMKSGSDLLQLAEKYLQSNKNQVVDQLNVQEEQRLLSHRDSHDAH